MSYFPDKSNLDSHKVYEKSIEGIDSVDNYVLGKVASSIINDDPKLLLFTLSRYKFVLKMLEGMENIVEVGCQEGFGALLFQSTVNQYVGLDFYQPHIASAVKAFSDKKEFSFYHHDILTGPHSAEQFDAVFSLDVLEHISEENEGLFFQSCLSYLHKSRGPLIVGMPSIESQKYASERSRIGHVNCKSKGELREACEKYFRNVFLFSMNDEVLHTGFDAMSHYVIALCVTPR